MHKMIPCLLALLAVGSVSPALAGKVYVPLLDRNGALGDRHATEIWIANGGAQGRRYETRFIPAGANGTVPGAAGVSTVVLGGRTVKLGGLTTAGAGLLEINAAPQLALEARMANSGASGPVTYSDVPVISGANALAAGTTAHLLGLGRSNAGAYTDLGVVNLGQQAAQCEVAFFRSNGTQIGSTASAEVPPLSMRTFPDALGLLGESQVADARVQVACNQIFYAVAGVFDPATAVLLLAKPAATGASTIGGGTTPPPPAGSPIVYTQSGLIHEPATGNEAKDFIVQVPRALSLRRMVIEWDVNPGPFTPGQESKSYSLIWVYRGKNRSNTIANVNAFGPARNEIKNTTNVDVLPAGLSSAIAPFVWQQDITYHFRYVYDAENGTVTLTVTNSANGAVLATLTQAATAANRTLTIPAAGFNVHFGHTAAQAVEGFEQPSYGWKYGNLRIEMTPY